MTKASLPPVDASPAILRLTGPSGTLRVAASGALAFEPAGGGPPLHCGPYGLQERGPFENGLCWSRGDRLIGEQYSNTLEARRLDDGRVRLDVAAEDGTRPGGFVARFAVMESGFTVAIEEIDDTLPSLVYPNPVLGESLVLPIEAGKWLREPLPKFARRVDRFAGHGLRMRFIGGYLDEASGAAWITIFARGHADAAVLRAGWGAAPLWMRSLGAWRGERVLRYQCVGDGYNGIARAFRGWADGAGLRVTLAEKCETRPQLRHIIGGRKLSVLFALPEWTEPIDRQWLPRTPNARPEAEGPRIHTRFEEGRQIFEEARSMGWRGLGQVVGWNHGGWDSHFPHAWPPEPRCGTETDFAELFRHDAGNVIGILDNYADTYPRAEGFPAGQIVRADGSRLEGAIWAGGQCYLTDYAQVIEAARANAARYRASGVQGVYCDTTTAVQLYENFDPAHRASRADDERARVALLAMFRDHGFTIGSERGCDFGVPVVDWSPSGFRHVAGETIPLWHLVFHDCHIQFAPAVGVDPDVSEPYSPDLLERHRRAWLPQFLYGGHLGHVRVTAGNWPIHRELFRGMAWVEEWQRRIGQAAMVSHQFVAPGVERTVWDNGAAMVANLGAGAAEIDGRALEPFSCRMEA